MKPIKQFEYAPMKVSFRKKVNLRKITEAKRNDIKQFLWHLAFTLLLAIGMVVLFFYALL